MRSASVARLVVRLPADEPLADAFDEVTSDRVAAALVVRHRGAVVVDVARGHDAPGRPFTSATPVLRFSAVKPYTALTVLLAAADGCVELDAPVASVWPAFAAYGKGAVTVAQALAYRGLCACHRCCPVR